MKLGISAEKSLGAAKPFLSMSFRNMVVTGVARRSSGTACFTEDVTTLVRRVS